MSWRKNVFEWGQRYKCKKTFTSGPSEFEKGEILIFERDTYSIYDSSSVFLFRKITNEEKGWGRHEEKGWWLHDDEPAEIWQEYFEREQDQVMTNE